MDSIVYGVTKNQTQLSDFHFPLFNDMITPDDTSEVILIERDALLNDKNSIEFLVLQFPAAGVASGSKHREIQGNISK